VVAPLRSGVGEMLAIHNESAVAHARLHGHPEGRRKGRQEASVVRLDAVAADSQRLAPRQRSKYSFWCYRGHHYAQVARIRTVHEALHNGHRCSVDWGRL
jgi:hypothetical protein